VNLDGYTPEQLARIGEAYARMAVAFEGRDIGDYCESMADRCAHLAGEVTM
jgi:hypothetical protein